jgi:hypothetical protein
VERVRFTFLRIVEATQSSDVSWTQRQEAIDEFQSKRSKKQEARTDKEANYLLHLLHLLCLLLLLHLLLLLPGCTTFKMAILE